MCNCGGSSRVARTASGPPPPRPSRGEEIPLRYLGRTALLVKGPASGRVYALRPGEPRLECDPRDAPHFLASPLFERFPR